MDTNMVISKKNKEEIIDRFVYELPILRTRIDLTQDEISDLIGISRQTYSSIETRKRKLTWNNYMSLLFLFYFNPATRDAVESAGVFSDELKKAMSVDRRRS